MLYFRASNLIFPYNNPACPKKASTNRGTIDKRMAKLASCCSLSFFSLSSQWTHLLGVSIFLFLMIKKEKAGIHPFSLKTVLPTSKTSIHYFFKKVKKNLFLFFISYSSLTFSNVSFLICLNNLGLSFKNCLAFSRPTPSFSSLKE